VQDIEFTVERGRLYLLQTTWPSARPAPRCGSRPISSTRAKAVCTEHGGRTSHAAVVSRELGRPAVVGCGEGLTAAVEGRLMLSELASEPSALGELS
jgi:PEP-utilising enzyme, mobile domain